MNSIKVIKKHRIVSRYFLTLLLPDNTKQLLKVSKEVYDKMDVKEKKEGKRKFAFLEVGKNEYFAEVN